MKTGIVFEGGAFRTIFSCGVMDAFLEKNIMPDYIIGVSAGAAYGVSYASRQPGRNLKSSLITAMISVIWVSIIFLIPKINVITDSILHMTQSLINLFHSIMTNLTNSMVNFMLL